MGGRGVVVIAVVLSAGGCARVGDRQHDAGHPIDAAAIDANAIDANARDAGPDASPAHDAAAMDAPHDAGLDAADGGHDASMDAGHDAAAIDAALAADSGVLTATWSTSASGLPCTVGARTTFHCPAGGTASSLWGTGEYTSDSSICTAAVHAGHIAFATGGDVTIEIRAGRSAYVASTRHGVTSSAYGAWACSYAVALPACLGASTDCSGLCADLTSDHESCGTCGTTCAATQSCVASHCACPGTQMLCASACVDTSTSSTHCGACGHACAASEICTAGSCTCAAGFTACASGCVDLSTSAANCGGCGMACAAGAVCTAMHCGGRAATWSTNATDHDCSAAGVLGSSFLYTCPAAGAAGSAWGTDLYTNDSSICTAAAHVGRITPATGGAVTITMQPGATAYPGTTRNGITTSTWGSWPCSYSVM
jgi:hypothetical protein